MPYTFEWAIEGRVVECKFSGTLTLEDIVGTRRDIIPFLRQGKPPVVHGLLDISEMERPDFGINELLSLPDIEDFLEDDFEGVPSGWRLYYGSDEVMFRFTMTIFHESHGHQSRWFKTREAALEFLCAEDDTLDCG